MPRRRLLAEEEIRTHLADIPDWHREGKSLTRNWTFEDFLSALAFINKVGRLAEAENHHPDIYNSWNRVTLALTTHDAGGLTEKDFRLAKKIDDVS
ncbi:MAG TPA: 4a-hydroxytetrahydrobiopterin dehydratase [Thermoplasmata archaeon]|jgi:4a-hydroxytetrahydrobiopterin dehydratase